MNSPARNRKPLTGLGRDEPRNNARGMGSHLFCRPFSDTTSSRSRSSPDRGFLFRAGEFTPRRPRTTGVGIHSPAASHDGRGNSFPGALARRAWEFIPRRSRTTGVGIHSPALSHDGRGNSFPGALARRAWEFIPRRSRTTGVGIHSPALSHDGRGNSFPGGLVRDGLPDNSWMLPIMCHC